LLDFIKELVSRPSPSLIMTSVTTDQQLEGLQIPDPSYGVFRKKEAQEKRLLDLATEHGILRIISENGFTVESATRYIETNSARIISSDFPKEHYGLLK